MPLVVAAIAPHGGIAIPESVPVEQRSLARATQEAMAELGRRFAAARPDATILLTPHNVHVERHMAVIVSGALEGRLGEAPNVISGAERPGVSLRVPVDREFAAAVLASLRDADIACVGVSYGGNDPASAVMPMDWATLIPLHYMGGRDDPPVRCVAVAPARDLSDEAHVRAGRALGVAAEASGKRVALIASCDHGHAHDPDGPYGYAPESKEFDDRIVDIVGRNALEELLTFDAGWIARAKPDSFWQMLMLHGAIGDGWRGELLSYEAPTYFGMLCAAYTPLDT